MGSSVCLSCFHRILLSSPLSTAYKLKLPRANAVAINRRYSGIAATHEQHEELKMEPDFDWNYILDPKNYQGIKENILNRKGIGDLDEVIRLNKLYNETKSEENRQKLLRAAFLIPNQTSSNSPIGTEFQTLKVHSQKTEFSFQPKSFRELAERLGLLKYNTPLTSHLVYGPRSYSLIGDLAALERALVTWTIDKLREKGFVYVVVPDLIPEWVINACGFVTTGKQNQIFKVRKDLGNLCLAGTSEMSMAGLYAGRSMPSDEPIKMCTYSQCFRAEEARNKVDKDFYRLHQFTKVEMFGICNPGDSDSLLEEIVAIQQELFSELGLHYRLLEMPSEELGAPAYRKFDIEAWMHAKQHWGEISSASNCTDYQARRLGIKTSNKELFAHTVNGTGCAVPRMLIALAEQFQNKYKDINIPGCLKPYMKVNKLRPQKVMKQPQWITTRPKKNIID